VRPARYAETPRDGQHGGQHRNATRSHANALRACYRGPSWVSTKAGQDRFSPSWMLRILGHEQMGRSGRASRSRRVSFRRVGGPPLWPPRAVGHPRSKRVRSWPRRRQGPTSYERRPARWFAGRRMPGARRSMHAKQLTPDRPPGSSWAQRPSCSTTKVASSANTTLGSTWEAGGGKVVGEVVQKVDSPDGKGVPWLLLRASSHQGEGTLTTVTSIQRVATSGGKAPSTACNAAHAGTSERVAYEVTYYFYVPPGVRVVVASGRPPDLQRGADETGAERNARRITRFRRVVDPV
jgi:hypothetical protein